MSSDEPRIVRDAMTISDVRELVQARFGDMVKACVDIGRSVMAIGGELHPDEGTLLLADGAKLADVWASISTPMKPAMAGSSSILSKYFLQFAVAARRTSVLL